MITRESKLCKGCGEIKLFTLFYSDKSHADGRGSKCKACNRLMYIVRYPKIKDRLVLQRKRLYKKNKVKILAMNKRWRDRDPAHVKALKRKYSFGLLPEQFSALTIKQGNRCAICREKLIKPYVDHCHKTKVIRGLLCCRCNVGLGMFRDSIITLSQASAYLATFNFPQSLQTNNKQTQKE